MHLYIKLSVRILETICDFTEEEQKLCFFGHKFKIHFVIDLTFKIIYFSQSI